MSTKLRVRFGKLSTNSLVWRPILLVVVALLAVAAHFFQGLDGSAIENGFRNALHVIGFAILAALVFEIVPAGTLVRSLLALLFVAIVGVTAEFAQNQVGRAEVADLYRDIAGATIFIVARVLWSLKFSSKILRGVTRTTSILIGALILAPFAYWASIVGIYLMRFPVILDFDERHDSYLFNPVNSEIEVLKSVGPAHDVENKLASIRLSNRGRSGVRIDTVIYDWSDYTDLIFDAEILHAEPINVTVHINDYDHIGRFTDTDTGRIKITNNWQRFRIPISAVTSEIDRGKYDSSDTRQIIIIARDKKNGVLMRLDNIRLE